MGRLPPGKVPWEVLAPWLAGSLPPEVRLGPAVGEDAALVEIGGELWAVASDPVTFTAERAGRLAVTVNANDVAVCGARPRLFTAVVLLAPAEADHDRVGTILGDIREACGELGAVLIGGHSEVTPDLPRSMVVGTMLGRVEGRPLTTGGVAVGDRIGLVGSAGLEGTAVLLAEHGGALRRMHGRETLADSEGMLAGNRLSIVGPALAAASVEGVTALHDVTEGGVGEALWELSRASGRALAIDRAAVPVRPETARLCSDLGIDPLGLLGSGALLVSCSPGSAARLAAELAALGWPLAWLGTALETAGPATGVPRFPRDEIVKPLLLAGIRGVVLDMDGTVVRSAYDWPDIRRRLGVSGGSLLDEIAALPEPTRSERSAELERIEEAATRAAHLEPGAAELLAVLRRRGLRTALATNNTAANAGWLLERFGLAFDVVVTRDSGFWKPSGAPIAEALRRLGVAPSEALAVGDSIFDLAAARDAGCALACVVNGGHDELRDRADLAFPDLDALARCLEIVRPESRA